MGITIRIGAGLTRAGIPDLCAGLAGQLRGRAAGVVTCDVTGAGRAEVVTAEALARLLLTARRHGWRLEITGAGPELRAVLSLLGLTGVLPQAAGVPQAPDPPRTGVSPQDGVLLQAGGQAEEREEPAGVEEVVEPGDPPA